jgi:glycosyltransferase involved in cell wall biosynthesis
MRIAFTDLLFAWPPHGGACTDLFHTARCLQEWGHEVRLFAAACDAGRERGHFDPKALPFPATRLEFKGEPFKMRTGAEKFRSAVDAWNPDVVFICDAFFFKPALALALQHHPTVGRFYAYEAVCPRDFRLFKDGALCPNSYLRTPDLCRRCTVEGMGPEIRLGQPSAWVREYLYARAYLPTYYKDLIKSLTGYRAVVVYNEFQRQLLEPYNKSVYVIPGGVRAEEFTYTERKPKKPGQPTIILMAGRAEDPAKGLNTLMQAGEMLARKRNDFQIWATLEDPEVVKPWYRPLGWQDHKGLVELYRQADIAVVPSVWAEPFGMVAVEAMATGLPVCASHSGALPSLISHGKTGFVTKPGDAGELAKFLNGMLDDPGLRLRMGAAARKRVEKALDWNHLVAHHYPPLLQMVTI